MKDRLVGTKFSNFEKAKVSIEKPPDLVVSPWGTVGGQEKKDGQRLEARAEEKGSSNADFNFVSRGGLKKTLCFYSQVMEGS